MKEFEYKGLRVDRETWESAPFPIDCSRIIDEKMQELVEELFNTLHCCYGYSEEDIMEYAKYEDHEDIDTARWESEEQLVLDYGGRYYDDVD